MLQELSLAFAITPKSNNMLLGAPCSRLAPRQRRKVPEQSAELGATQARQALLGQEPLLQGQKPVEELDIGMGASAAT